MNKAPLSSIANIEMGQSPLGESCNAMYDGVPLLNGPAEFTDNFPIPVQYTTDPKRFSVVGDILFCVRGSTTGRMNWSDRRYAIGRGLAAINHKEGLLFNRFLKYLIQNHLNSLLNNSNGSTFPNLTYSLLSSFELYIPNKGDSLNISMFLNYIDKKIEINNKINAELEAMAKFIYDYWFMQFDFPDANGNPYKSSGGKMVYNKTLKREIPDRWEVKELGKLIEFERGISYKSKEIKEGGASMINLNSFNLSGKYKHTGLKYFSGSYKENKICSAGDLVIAITDVTRNADIIGRSFTIPDLFDGDILISCDVAKVVPSDRINKRFLEQLFNSVHYHDYIKHFASGTLVLHLNLDGVKWCKIPLPPVELLNKYSLLKQNFDEKISQSIKENIKLSNLRDWLVPLLMNGQVTVKDSA